MSKNILDVVALNAAAREFQAAKEQYTNQWILMAAIRETLPVDLFWGILDFMRDRIRFEGPNRYVSRTVCHGLFQIQAMQEIIINDTSVSFNDLCNFIYHYRQVVTKLAENLSSIIEGKTVYAHNDLCDSLPLIGRVGVQSLFSMTEGNNEDVLDVMATHLNHETTMYGAAIWRKFIWSGLNYFRVTLAEEAQQYYVLLASQHDPKPQPEILA